MLFQKLWSIKCCRGTHAHTHTHTLINKQTGALLIKWDSQLQTKGRNYQRKEPHDHINEKKAINSVIRNEP